MSRSSAEASPANRAAGTLILVLIALIFAVLSTKASLGEERGVSQAPSAAATTASEPQFPTVPRGLFSAGATADQVRRYPTVQTSDAAGALGICILSSLFAIFLGAAAAPLILHRMREMH